MTVVRLAYFPLPAVDIALGGATLMKKVSSPMHKEYQQVRLAYTPGAQGENSLLNERHVGEDLRPALLVSFVYLKKFLEKRHKYHYRDWVLDSGAFSAWKSGKKIDLQEYIDTCHKLLETDPTLTEVFSLDVIGDWEGTARNTEEMWRQGIPAIPAFHYGEPEEALIDMAKTYPKIALGGIVGLGRKEKKRWIGQCFARVWPKKIHGFGVTAEDILMSFPFHSVDATNWEIGPCAYGRWARYGKLSIRGSRQDLTVEVQYYLELEQKVRNRWKREMEILEAEGPTVRLAMNMGYSYRYKALERALIDGP